MTRKMIFLMVIGFCGLCMLPNTLAHVPYIEHRDFSTQHPFKVKSITQSLGVYAWLETDHVHPSTDVDVYTFTIQQPTLVHLEVLVPVVNGYYYVNFTPWFALVGPGLPAPNQTLPFNLSQGDGVIVVQDLPPGHQRKTFFEPFGIQWYYQGPIFNQTMDTSGTYYVYYWDHYQTGGDYVAVLGYLEQFPPIDILRSIVNVPLIRHNMELHLPKT
ncbi:MAG TPA: hypothetical protein VMT57_02420 [Candidatus Thermoplasmatota archaeon]|nr:hypothetical protein [Candidatus Thermoplasmatota archaeon]